MKFRHVLAMKAKINRQTKKDGIERDKGKFDGLQNGEEIVVSKDEIIGKTGEGKQFVKLITGWEKFIVK